MSLRAKLILFISLLMVGCGYNNAYKDIHKLQQQQSELEREQTELADKIAALTQALITLESNLQAQIVLTTEFADNIANTDAELQALQNQYLLTVTQVISMGQQLATLTGQVHELEAEDRLVSMLDPCGDMAGQFDEVLLVTASGKVVAYFEAGNRRHLTVLVPNQAYVTTDVQACNFSVNALGQLN
jgi:hypothetical protein